MQIVCDQCGKKYKTREKKTKPFKIRCTQCPNVFVVDPSKLQDDEATRQVSKEMAESLLAGQAAVKAEVSEWYAVVAEQQAGPFTNAQLSEMWNQGKINAQTYVWKDGMGGWELITSVSALSSVFHSASSVSQNLQQSEQRQVAQQREAAQREAAQREAAQREAAQREAAQREAVQREAAQREAAQREAAQREAAQREAVQHLQNRPQIEVQHSPSLVINKMTSPKDESLLSSSQNMAPTDSREPSSVLTTAQLKNQRNDNSVLFSLDAIEGLTAASPAVEKTAPKPSISNTGGKEGSGLIDISVLGSGFGDATSLPGGGRATINLTSGMKKPPMMSKSSNHLPLILASVFLTILASGTGFYFFVFQPQQQAVLQAANTKKTITLSQNTLTQNQMVKADLPVPQQNNLLVQPPTTQTNILSENKTDPVPTPTESTQEEVKQPEKTSEVKKVVKQSRSTKQKRARRASKPKPSSKPEASTKNTTKKRSGEASSLLSNLRGKSSSQSSGLPNLTGSSSSRSVPAKPSKDDIRKAMGRVNVGRCGSYEPSLKGKRLFVQIKIVSNGSVESASALPPARGTTTGSCLEREIRKQRVPAFKDSNVSFKYPFQF